MIEHMNHAGTENGNLEATYDQLAAYGATRSEISSAIDEGVALGLIRAKRGGRWAGTNHPNVYRLTWLPDRNDNPPTNEWKRVTEAEVIAWREKPKASRSAQGCRR